MQLGYWDQQRTPFVQVERGDDPEEVIAEAQRTGAVITFGEEDYLVLLLPPNGQVHTSPSLYTETVAALILPQLVLS